MEKLKEVISELEQMDPMDWHNIAKPIVKGFILLKSSSSIQGQYLEYMDKHYSDFEGRCNTRILNMQKSVSENIDKSKESDEGFKTMMKFLELRVNDKVDDYMKKVTEDLYILKCSSDGRMNELKENINECLKRIELIPTSNQIQTMISSYTKKSKEKTLNEVKETLIPPEISALSQKIHLQNIAIDSLHQKISTESEENKQQDQKLLDDFIELNTKMIQFQQDQNERTRLFHEHFQNISKRLEEISGIREEIEHQNQQNISILTDYKQIQNQKIKKFENGLQSCKESIDTMKQNLTQLKKPEVIRPPTPPPQPVVAPAEPVLLEIPWDEINSKITSKIDSLRGEVIEKIADDKKKTNELIQSRFRFVEMQSEKNKDQSNTAIQELKDKLNWLPISLSQLEGMTPGEARLFTIEARLRSEENSRIQAFNHLLSLVDSLASQCEEFKESDRKPRTAAEKVLNLRASERKKTPQPPVSSDSYRKMESERRPPSETGSVLAQRFKFSTPVPEVEESREILAAYKEKRKNKAVPNSWDAEFGQIHRIQTAIPAKNKLFRPGKTNIL